MKMIKYTEEQMNKISDLVKNISVKGDSVLSLAMVIQELNNGVIEEVKKEIKKEVKEGNGQIKQEIKKDIKQEGE